MGYRGEYRTAGLTLQSKAQAELSNFRFAIARERRKAYRTRIEDQQAKQHQDGKTESYKWS